MKLKEVSCGKEIKIGLPNFSNIDVRCDLKFDIAEGEEPNWDEIWDMVNSQLSVQTSGLDPSWITNSDDYKKFFKVVIRLPKKDKNEK